MAAVQAQRAIAFEPFQQRLDQRAQACQLNLDAALLVHRHAPDGALAFARGGDAGKGRVGEHVAQDRQQVDALAADVDAERDVEPGVAAGLDVGVPGLDVDQFVVREAGFVFDAEAGGGELLDGVAPVVRRPWRFARMGAQQYVIGGEVMAAGGVVVQGRAAAHGAELFQPLRCLLFGGQVAMDLAQAAVMQAALDGSPAVGWR